MLYRSKARIRPSATATIKRRARSAVAWSQRVRTVNAVNALAACILTYVAWNVYRTRTDSANVHISEQRWLSRTVFGHAGYVQAKSAKDAPAAAHALFRNQQDEDQVIMDTFKSQNHPVSFEEMLAAGPILVQEPPIARARVRLQVRDRTIHSGKRKLPPLTHAFALVQSGCRVQWNAFLHHALLYNLRAYRVDVHRTRTINLHSPPIPLDPVLERIASHSHGRHSHANLRRHIAYMVAHKRAWQKVLRWNLPYALISDSHLFPSELAMEKVNKWIAEASASNPWHVLMLRRARAQGARDGASIDKFGELSEVAQSTIGASSYIVSNDGARILLNNIRAYRGNIDEELKHLKKELGNQFIILAPNCKKHLLCDQFTLDIISDRKRNKFNCIWRIIEEKKWIRRLQSTK